MPEKSRNERRMGERCLLRAFGACVWLALLCCPVNLHAADFSDGTAVQSTLGQIEMTSDASVEGNGADFTMEEKLAVQSEFDVPEESAEKPAVSAEEENGTQEQAQEIPEITPVPSLTAEPQKIYVVIENPQEETTSEGSVFYDGTGQTGASSGVNGTGESENGAGENGNGEGEDEASGAGDDLGTDAAYDSGATSSYASGTASETEEIVRQPKLLLDTGSLTGEELEPGAAQTISVSFTNRSGTQAAYNLEVKVSGDEIVTFEKNSYYISKVAPGESKTLDITLKLGGSAAAASLPLTFTFEYEDKNGTTLTSTEILTLQIPQQTEAELITEELPASVYSTDTLEISLTARNSGRTAIYNARISLSGTGLFPTGEVYLGNLEFGSEGTGSMRVYVGTRTMESIGEDSGASDAEKYGSVSGTITLTYEDADGNSYQISKDYETEIKKPKTLSLKVEEDGEPEANSWWISVFAVVIAGLFLTVLFLLLHLRRKNILLAEAREG